MSGIGVGTGSGAGTGMDSGSGSRKSARLLHAARAGDETRVRALLDAGADPDATGPDGLSALDLAADGGNHGVVDALVTHGARVDRVAPDGWAPLLRAVDAGASGAAIRLVGSGAAALGRKNPVGLTALELARHWHATGAETELRLRAGSASTEPVERHRVADDEYSFTELLRIGGRRVRTGHAAILTRLEASSGMRTPFGTLLARAEAEEDPFHAVRAEAVAVLYERGDRATWVEAAALIGHPRPSVRHFGVDVARCLALFDACGRDGDCVDGPGCLVPPTRELLLAGLPGESDPDVLALMLRGLTDCAVPDFSAVLVPHVTHPAAVVRRAVVAGLHGIHGIHGRHGMHGGHGAADGDPAVVRPVLLTYLRDPDPQVRTGACAALAERGERAGDIRDALAGLLTDPDVAVRVESAVALVLLDDPRGEPAVARLRRSAGDGEDSPFHWRFYDAARHLAHRRTAAGPVTGSESGPGPGSDPDPDPDPDPGSGSG
ncbi:HEAT repeat domain-containing protein [Streptomyces sp. NPDC048272]|uniref:HEAT repeat domain-containing protein n=1 Tax=Streptomyces sp. NPDC048272 TaxID=3154616 RepID=UPI00342AA47A